jgi:hypothetical protein
MADLHGRACRVRISRAGSLKDDWSLPKTGVCQKKYGSDQWAAAPLQRVAYQ